MKTMTQGAGEALQNLLQQVPAIAPDSIHIAPHTDGDGFTLGLNTVAGLRRMLLCGVRSNGQPRHVRHAVLSLRDGVARAPSPAIPVLIAPYLSAAARAICQQQHVSFFDLEGNCRLVFDGIYIERTVATRPATARRHLRSLFSPKAAQVLYWLLSDVQRQWRVAELAQQADVSVGQVSNVRHALIDKEWAAVGQDGLQLSNADAVLDAWRDAYQPPGGTQLTFYTALHGAALDRAVANACRDPASAQVLLASYSAAQWQAPYARSSKHFFYADPPGLDCLKQQLQLVSTTHGENVQITVPDDPSLLRHRDQPAPGIWCTSPLQTYLDLSHHGERGQEAAAHLRAQCLRWPV